jgi:hypothetical protein
MKVITMRVSDEGNNYECLMKVINMRVSDEGNNYESV